MQCSPSDSPRWPSGSQVPYLSRLALPPAAAMLHCLRASPTSRSADSATRANRDPDPRPRMDRLSGRRRTAGSHCQIARSDGCSLAFLEETTMASTPHPPPKPEPPPPPPPIAAARAADTPQLGADSGSTSDHTVDPPDPGMETIVHEQRRRSAEIEEAGLESWKAAHDGRSAEERGQPKQVPGVAPHPHEDDEHSRRHR